MIRMHCGDWLEPLAGDFLSYLSAAAKFLVTTSCDNSFREQLYSACAN